MAAAPAITLHQAFGSLYYIRRARQRGALEARVVRHRRVERCDTLDRCVQMIERGFVDLRGDLRSGAASAPALVDYDRLAGLLHRSDYRIKVERIERAQIDH